MPEIPIRSKHYFKYVVKIVLAGMLILAASIGLAWLVSEVSFWFLFLPVVVLTITVAMYKAADKGL